MPEDTETVLTNSLRAIDRVRRRVLAGGWLAVLVTLGAYARFYYVLENGAGISELIAAAVMALTCLVAWTAFSVILIVTRMTRRILRAVELASK